MRQLAHLARARPLHPRARGFGVLHGAAVLQQAGFGALQYGWRQLVRRGVVGGSRVALARHQGQALRNVAGSVDVEAPGGYCLDHARRQHQVALVAGGDQHAVAAVQTVLYAQVEPAFDLFIQAAHGQYVAMLVERTGDGNVLQQRHA